MVHGVQSEADAMNLRQLPTLHALLLPIMTDIPVQKNGRDVIGQLDLAQACRMDVRQILQPIPPA